MLKQLKLLTVLTLVFVILIFIQAKMFWKKVSPPTAAAETDAAAAVQSRSLYVSLCRERLTGNHRTGNHLFFLASLVHVSRVTGRRLVMPRTGWYLDRVFDVDVPRLDDVEGEICPCTKLRLPRYDYDRRFDDPKFVASLIRTRTSILVCGFSQTYRYAARNERQLRKILRFSADDSRSADLFLSGLQRTSPDHVTIGVHVRRGDFLNRDYSAFGLTVADKTYFDSAFAYFVRRRSSGPLHFVVATEDRKWSSANLPEPSPSRRFTVAYSANSSAGTDMAILSRCDGVVMSTGSFGWWAAWLANKTTIYYKNWPRNGTRFDAEMNRTNYFPPHWIPL